MDVDDFLALSASRLDMMCDLDSVSQISAMDSASQTGSVILSDHMHQSRHHHQQNRPIFSSDSNIHRSLAETLPHQSRAARAGQFPYAYIRLVKKFINLPNQFILCKRYLSLRL